MIRIDSTTFDWNAINKIYSPTGILISNIKTRMESAYSTTRNLNLKGILEAWFITDTQIDPEKIGHFLLNDNPKRWIEEYETIVSTSLELQWLNIRDTVLSEHDRSIRKALILSVINNSNVDSFSGITVTDLSVSPQSKTIYSSKEKIKKIKFNVPEQGIDSLKQELSKIFDYELLSSNRDLLLSAMGISVCPYCNRQYITSLRKNNSTKSTADIDHFYSKATYPFLALSLYNFVPSCQICNSHFKSTKDFWVERAVYPYERGFGKDCVFELENVDTILHTRSTACPNFKLKLLKKDIEIEHSIDTFHLNEVYQSHKDYVKELIEKAQFYNETQLQDFIKNFEHLFSSKDEMKRILFGNYLLEDDFGKRPLAKLTRDILQDIGVEL